MAVAASGGADSLALAILTDQWARTRGGEAWAVTIDHRLRPESAAEIERLRGWLAARGIPHEVRVWAGPKPRSGIQEAAREARYRLLADWCRERGCLHLLTAHHREDQVETHLIRRRAGSGPDGLAGMSTVRELDGCLLLRPLLGFSRERLIALLDSLGQPFIVDPSNRDPAFERSRLRGDAAPTATDTEAVLAELAVLGRARAARESARDALLASAVAPHPAGFATLDPALLADAPEPIAQAALGSLALAIGGARYPLRRERVARLRAALAGPPAGGCTLGGCRFVSWRNRILVFREPAAAAAAARLDPGECLVWDRRFAAALPDAAVGPIWIGCLGTAGVAELNRMTRRPPQRSVPRLTYPALAAAWDRKGLLTVPHLGYYRGDAAALPRISLHPLIPLIRSGFTVVCG